MNRPLKATLLAALCAPLLFTACASWAQAEADVPAVSLEAVESALAAGDAARAEALLNRLPPASMDKPAQQRAALLRARARLAQKDSAGALKALPNGLDSPEAEQLLDVRAKALFADNDTISGTTARVLRESLLSPANLAANRDALWKELALAPLPANLSTSVDVVVRGWLEAAALARPGSLPEAKSTWLAQHGFHPAAQYLKPSPAIEENLGGFALILPLSGPLAAAAEAVKNGAIAAMNQTGPNAPLLQIHDSQQGVGNALASALARNALGLIGPLRKEDIVQLAQLAPTIPTVALNYPDTPLPANFVALGLAPEDEARSAAEDALRANLRGAVVVALEGDWGSRTAKAFTAAFTAGGGTVVAQGQVKPNTNDYGPILKPLLGINAAQARQKQLGTLGIAAELEPHPNSDIDVVFLAVRGRHAQLITPQLRFLDAGNLPVYAVAAAADSGDAELQAVRVCDIPWRQNAPELAELKTSLASSNPKGSDTQRLFALGYDAYHLAVMQQQNPGAMPPMQGLSGTLSQQANGIRRSLACQAMTASPEPSPTSSP